MYSADSPKLTRLWNRQYITRLTVNCHKSWESMLHTYKGGLARVLTILLAKSHTLSGNFFHNCVINRSKSLSNDIVLPQTVHGFESKLH